jgi:predicted transcriptional regulator
MMARSDTSPSVGASKEDFMKRSRDMIISQILDICTAGASKTRIVYQANLNFRTVNPYLELLTKNGLVHVKDGATTIYETTDRGADLLTKFKQIHEEISKDITMQP